MMFWKLIHEFEWFFMLFATPFFVAEIAVLGIVGWMLFGRQQLTLCRDGATLRWSVPGFSRTRSAKLSELRDVEEYTWGTSNDKPMYGVRINTTGKPLPFAFQADEDERRWLLYVLKEQLGSLNAGSKAPASRFSAPAMPLPSRRDSESAERWQIEDNIRTVTLRIRNELNLGLLAGVTFAMLFWNGIVAVFVAQLFQRFDWFLFFFLLPFEIVGLILVGFWLLTLLAPLTTVTWTLDGNELTRRVRIALFWWISRWPTHAAVRSERAADPKAKSSESIHTNTGRCWRVRLIDDQNREIAALKLLTEAQATAFHDAIRRRLVKA